MIYNPEIVRKNIKYMRNLYGITQSELSDIIHVSQHGISLYESGKRGLNYDLVQTLANYFRIPVEQFVKEDLSENISLNLPSKIDFFHDFYKILFPIVSSPNAIKDNLFQKGYTILSNIINHINENQIIYMDDLDNCFDFFVSSYNNNKTIESMANAIGVTLLLLAPSHDQEKLNLGMNMFKKNTLSKDDFKEHYLQKDTYNNFLNEEFIPKYEDFIMIGITELKKSSKYADLGDYYLALKYILGYVENEYNEDMNFLIGEELMGTLFVLGNKYAATYWNKKYGSIKNSENITERD